MGKEESKGSENNLPANKVESKGPSEELEKFIGESATIDLYGREGTSYILQRRHSDLTALSVILGFQITIFTALCIFTATGTSIDCYPFAYWGVILLSVSMGISGMTLAFESFRNRDMVPLNNDIDASDFTKSLVPIVVRTELQSQRIAMCLRIERVEVASLIMLLLSLGLVAVDFIGSLIGAILITMSLFAVTVAFYMNFCSKDE